MAAGVGALLWGLVGGCAPPPPLSSSVEMATLPPCVQDDCNCGDFRTQVLAQQVLSAFSDDPFVLDRDGNGQACESLPATAPDPDPPAPSVESAHLMLGNPSNAASRNPNNYLLVSQQYVLAYNSDRGTANWASWQLSRDSLGTAERQDDFRQNGDLPAGIYQVTPNDYRDSGFDRGHIVPSGDRTASVQDNSATFLMTNMVPQAPENNRGLWRELEEYSRDQVVRGDQTLLIVAGAYGDQGTLAGGRVMVPSRLWKVIVVLAPEQGIEDIDADTPVIALDVPNRDVASGDWRRYQTTVDQIEVATGYDLLSAVAPEIQAVIEAE